MKNSNYQGTIIRHEAGRGWEYDGNYYQSLSEVQDQIDSEKTKPQTFGPQKVSYQEYIKATIEERVITAAQDEIWEQAQDIAGRMLTTEYDGEGSAEKEYDAIYTRVVKDLTKELVNQLIKYGKQA